LLKVYNRKTCHVLTQKKRVMYVLGGKKKGMEK